jgi:CTP:molybdopterin cytidylyltransferase MocA
MQASPSLSAILLAAGYSSRMGAFKPLLELGGLTAIDRVIDAYRSVGVADIHVVTGYRSTAVQAAVHGRPVNLVRNPQHAAGMFSSVVAGVRALPDRTDMFFVHPVDIPLVRPYTLTRLMDAGRSCAPSVVYPAFDGRRGHPPLIRGRLGEAIRAHDGQGGLRAVLERYDSEARDVAVADCGVLLDMDTPDDYAQLAGQADGSAILNDEECRVLMEKVCRLPASIIDHCRQVANVAARLARAVNAAGGTLDIAGIRAAALVHDVARLESDHAAAGAHLLSQMGFAGLARMVGTHMQIHVDSQAPIDEAQVVHLADKLVSGSTVVSLDDRFDARHNQYGSDPVAARRIEQRRRTAQTIQAKVERLTGKPIEHIAKDE